jgi:uncharacterized protein YbdZ (MbtH family)
MGNRRASRNRVVCTNRSVPVGWVVVGSYHNPACPAEGANAWIVKRPGRREVVCAGTPVPEGWRAVGEAHSDSCPGSGMNALLIERQDIDAEGEDRP